MTPRQHKTPTQEVLMRQSKFTETQLMAILL